MSPQVSPQDLSSSVNPQLVRAKITIRSLQEELNSLRETDAPDRFRVEGVVFCDLGFGLRFYGLDCQCTLFSVCM